MEHFFIRKNITSAEEGMTVKEYVGELGISKRLLTDIKFGEGDLLINGEHVTVKYVLREGDLFVVKFPEEQVSETLLAEPVPLDILYEDEHVLVINKQPYVSSIPSREHPSGSIANGIIHHYQKNGVRATVHLVTRLDRDTSGVMLVAKHRFAHSILSSAQKNGLVKRRYVAVVHGRMTGEGTVDAPIGRHPDSIIERRVTPDGQKAVTHFYVTRATDDITSVTLQLETGRTHQIRVHMSYLGHPLCGDTLYGGTRQKIGRQALHSEHLSFIHPLTQENMTFHAALPQDMKELTKS
ncbi:RluA family pseudouridine synthase [Bacillus inaquosorum]|uniref:RluA family pseudouridine synthase n=1 Tax=Bacillus inaquosorum TaxID=483913 RepID=UPI000745B9D9|nr:RluA family pseudouridine synthase [Bacillus inaquosorum]CAF1832983.1 Ribosomal large subunit pseudouridine synthase D [Bacillus subtilis]AMA51854.1 RNA pseudouridine synthase [Bacillus inaquosorum]MBT2189776.1 RluA family pseudouridine synthase [Bacillus inaquosorum]MBT3116529.1 RluA family pseudouridine synthase [Bacillus inaquosorum]MBT3120986.1 RluA family pseudouridine synthase [Bacillus inaquosorum]